MGNVYPFKHFQLGSCTSIYSMVAYTFLPKATFLPLHHVERYVLVLSEHHANMSVQCKPLTPPLLSSKIGVYKDIHYFLIIAFKHRLWVLVRTASMGRFWLRRSNVYPQPMFWSKIRNITCFHTKITIFTAVKFAHVCYSDARVFAVSATTVMFAYSLRQF